MAESAKHKRYRLKHQEEVRKNIKLHRKRHPEVVRARRARYRLKHPEKMREQWQRRKSKFKLEHPEECKALRRKYQARAKAKLKLEAIQHYGGKCTCCNESRTPFLTIDHIDGNGSQHRKVAKCGKHIHVWLKKHGYPAGFQVLCWNCNCGRAINNGICPHNEI